MDDGARLWLLKTARKHYWRVSRWYDLDDLIQEGYAAYCKTLKKYPDATDAPHRMALFKRVFMNRLHDLANERTRAIHEMCESDCMPSADMEGGRTLSPLDRAIADSDISEVVSVLASAPQYVKDAVALFGSEDGLMRLRSAYRKMPAKRGLKRETLNERLCRLTGHDPKQVDIVGALRACLAPE